MSKKIGVVVGSLRAGSYNRSVARALCEMLPEGFTAEFLEIGSLPLYNEDLDKDSPPAAWQAFRERVGAMDAYLFVTPEYNRGIPGVLKNAIDVASRPYGENQWGKKPAAVASASPGGMGGFGANHALRQSLVFVDVYPLQQPEAYVAHVDKGLDENGAVSSEGTRAFLRQFADAFCAWVLQFYGEK